MSVIEQLPSAGTQSASRRAARQPSHSEDARDCPDLAGLTDAANFAGTSRANRTHQTRGAARPCPLRKPLVFEDAVQSA